MNERKTLTEMKIRSKKNSAGNCKIDFYSSFTHLVSHLLLLLEHVKSSLSRTSRHQLGWISEEFLDMKMGSVMEEGNEFLSGVVGRKRLRG